MVPLSEVPCVNRTNNRRIASTRLRLILCVETRGAVFRQVKHRRTDTLVTLIAYTEAPRAHKRGLFSLKLCCDRFTSNRYQGISLLTHSVNDTVFLRNIIGMYQCVTGDSTVMSPGFQKALCICGML